MSLLWGRLTDRMNRVLYFFVPLVEGTEGAGEGLHRFSDSRRCATSLLFRHTSALFFFFPPPSRWGKRRMKTDYEWFVLERGGTTTHKKTQKENKEKWREELKHITLTLTQRERPRARKPPPINGTVSR